MRYCHGACAARRRAERSRLVLTPVRPPCPRCGASSCGRRSRRLSFLRRRCCCFSTGLLRWRPWPTGLAYPGRENPDQSKKLSRAKTLLLMMIVAQYHPRPTSYLGGCGLSAWGLVLPRLGPHRGLQLEGRRPSMHAVVKLANLRGVCHYPKNNKCHLG